MALKMAKGRVRSALARRLEVAAVVSSFECLICLGDAFDSSKARSKWYQCREGHLLCEACSAVSCGASCSACTSPMGASRTTLMDSIRCRALEAVVLLMDAGDAEESRDAACQTAQRRDVEGTRDAGCQTSSEDRCVDADQTRLCPHLTKGIAASAVAWAGDGGDDKGPMLLSASSRAPRVPEELVAARGCDQTIPPTYLHSTRPTRSAILQRFVIQPYEPLRQVSMAAVKRLRFLQLQCLQMLWSRLCLRSSTCRPSLLIRIVTSSGGWLFTLLHEGA